MERRMKSLLIAAATAVATTMLCLPAQAVEAGDFMVRGRLLGVVPDEAATVSIGGGVDIETSVVPEVDLTYFITDNIGVEVIAAVTPHDVSHSTGVELGDVWLLPPTVTLQYHFNPKGKVKPYVGAGVNYTHFFNEDAGPNFSSVNYDDSWGLALQAGVDYQIGDNLYLNVDVKKIEISTDVSFDGGAVTANVDIDPWIIGAGVGYRF
jgi:outer membrane protein